MITSLIITRKNINYKMSKIKGKDKHKENLSLLDRENLIDLTLNNIYTLINKDFDEYEVGKKTN